jgi:hypothetical protein
MAKADIPAHEPLSKQCEDRSPKQTLIQKLEAKWKPSTIQIGSPLVRLDEVLETIRQHEASQRSEMLGDEGFDLDKARKELTPKAMELLKQPIVQSLLYDIDLLPEQIRTSRHWFYMLAVLTHMSEALKREIGSAPEGAALVKTIDKIWGHGPLHEECVYAQTHDGVWCEVLKFNSIEMVAPMDRALETDVLKHLESLIELGCWSSAAQIGVAVGFDRPVAAKKVLMTLRRLENRGVIESERGFYPIIYRHKPLSKVEAP